MYSLIELLRTYATVQVAIATVVFLAALFAVLGFLGFRPVWLRPRLKLRFAIVGDEKKVPRDFVKKDVTFVAFEGVSTTDPFQILYFSLNLINDSDRHAISNLRVTIDFDARHMVSNEEIAEFVAAHEISESPIMASDGRTVGHASTMFSKDAVRDVLEHRRVIQIRDRVQSEIELPVLRPGETACIQDIIRFPGAVKEKLFGWEAEERGSKYRESMVLAEDRILEVTPVNINVFSGNHRPLRKSILLFFLSKGEPKDALESISRAFWLGEIPKPGVRFVPAGLPWIFKKLGIVGRSKGPFIRQEFVEVRSIAYVNAKTPRAGRFRVHVPEYTFANYGQIGVPNCDVFSVPNHIDTARKVREWIFIDPPSGELFARRRKRI